MGNMLSEFSAIIGGTGSNIEGNFKQNLERYARRVSDDFVKYNKDMNASIAKIASENKYNDDQIQRLVEEANNTTYLSKYAGLKNQTERDVVFPTASLDKVKEIIGEPLAKTASENFHVDAFSSYTPYKTGAIECFGAEDNLKNALAEKIASDISETSDAYHEASNKFDAQIYKVADMLIRYDRVGGVDINEAYSTICKDARLRAPMQDIIQKVANQIIEDEKFVGRINSEYSLTLPHVDIYEREKDFSLGDFSCMKKEASYFPVMQIGEDVVRSIADMVKIASEIKPLFDKVAEAKATYDYIDKIFEEV